MIQQIFKHLKPSKILYGGEWGDGHKTLCKNSKTKMLH